MGSVILIGVLADQQFARYRERRSAQGSPADQSAAIPLAADRKQI
jgi:hypothetical protein